MVYRTNKIAEPEKLVKIKKRLEKVNKDIKKIEAELEKL